MASSSTKRHLPLPDGGGGGGGGGERESKRTKPSLESTTTPPLQLNPADCNLDFDVGDNGLEGQALHESGFAYCWSGARATTGIVRGKYCFGCKIICEQKVDMEDTPSDQQHLCRVGISRGDDPVGNLGETASSFGFGGTGMFSTGGKFSCYGTKFGVGDSIVCAVDLESKPFASIGFSKNGKWLGSARQFNKGPRGLGVTDPLLQKQAWESAYFPHVLLKNVVVQMQFSMDDGLLPEDGYKPWSSALEDGNAVSGPHFPRPKECEVMMMVGLPGSGKSTWAEKWIREHPDKRYILLGTNLALDQMKVPGLLRQKNYGERFEHLMDHATGIFNTLLSRAAKTPRNYIIDQTNVYKSARKRKMKEFTNFPKIAVVVFPTPDELKIRADKRYKEQGKEVPAEAVNEMLANYVLPLSKDIRGSSEPFDQVMFPELGRVEAQKYLDEMKHALVTSPTLSKKSYSPYSRDSSILSLDSGRHFPLPARAFERPLQVHENYGGPSFYGSPGSSERFEVAPCATRLLIPGDPRASMPRDDPYRSYLDYGRISYPRNDSIQFSSHGGTDSPYVRSNFERNSLSRVNTYQRYGENSVNNNLNYGFDYQSLSTLPCASPGASFAGPMLPLADQPFGSLPIEQQGSFSGSFSYRNPIVHHGERRDHQEDPPFSRRPHYGQRDPFPSQYGSCVATPPPNPSYSDQQGMQGCHSQGHHPSGPWHR